VDTDRALADYYARRAAEYERIYEKPERQADLARLEENLASAFPGLDVLEVACGTGYWTRCIARSARRIVAFDVNAEVLDIARQKEYGSCQVSLLQADAYTLEGVASDCVAGFHAFWWSHVPIQRLAGFLRAFHAHLPVGAPVVMIDNAYVEGSSTPIARHDEYGNTYQVRQLNDGSRHEVLKNFPSPSSIPRHLVGQAEEIEVTQLTYYWLAKYRTR
jgi:demethylmenaquinone methyltransferase/2-methoxy-6-polyprenyl-1,4-benzoquinol methylase